MRVYCTEHKRGFFAPRQSPVKCENKGHILGEFNFDGEAATPLEIQWQYCCNCEHFCPLEVAPDGLERCPVCTRRSSMLYLCDRCYTISFESNTPQPTKNFTLTSEGVPQPSCPGCLQATATDLREHICDGIGVSLITALNACPICQERLDIGPSFPCSVAYYLKRTKVANRVNVTFDYETGLFMPVGDGEFVLISNGSEGLQSIVLPRSALFTTRRDFYEFYQDFYHCTKPDAGEVQIVQPAAVAPSREGWIFQTPGILEMVEDPVRKNAAADVKSRKADRSGRVEPGLSLAIAEDESPATPCTNCGALVETKYPFCWKCGRPMKSKSESFVKYTEPPKIMERSAAIATGEEDLTLQHEAPVDTPPLFSWAVTKDLDGLNSAKGSVIKLIAVAAIVLGLLALGLFALRYSISRKDSESVAQVAASNGQSDPSLKPGGEPKREGAAELAQPVAAHPVDEVLKTLREKRIAATDSNRSAVLQAFIKAEKQYPNDYRLPYERAKLTIQNPLSGSPDEAFGALSLAAERAIGSAKAHEMLHGLSADKARDFLKLSQMHREWGQLVKALRSNDSSLLIARLQL